MPEVSVIVPVYKVEPYLRQCVDSILAQTFTDFELILVDDGSPDNCPAICDEYAERDSRVRVIHHRNRGGQSVARNTGIEWALANSNSQWINFVDSDDVVHPQMLERLYRAAVDGHANISVCAVLEASCISEHFFREYKDMSFTSMKMDEQGLTSICDNRSHYSSTVWGKLIRKDIVQSNLFAAGRIYEDNAVINRWLVKAKIVSIIDDILYFYRINPQGTTKSAFSLKHLDSLWAACEAINYFDSIGFKSLKARWFSFYMQSAASKYWRVLNELSQPTVAADLKKQIRWMMMANRQDVRKLSKQVKLAVYEVFYPKTVRLYWMYRAAVCTVKKKGIAGLAKNICVRLRGGAS